LLPYLPIPVVKKSEVEGVVTYDWAAEKDIPETIGRLSGFMGNAGVLLRAYVYMRMVGRDGMERVAEYATLNANYLMAKLRDAGFELAYPDRRASHEFIVTLKHEAKEIHLSAMDMAKALLDRNFHAPTTYFPLLVPECLLIEPTETESKETLDNFVAAMISIVKAAREDGVEYKEAPYKMPVRRLDDVKAARELDLRYNPE
jgi:glycine dehydrogenase subunit 2